jgi:hypothetical protein
MSAARVRWGHEAVDGPKLPIRNIRYSVATGGKADVMLTSLNGRF